MAKLSMQDGHRTVDAKAKSLPNIAKHETSLYGAWRTPAHVWVIRPTRDSDTMKWISD